MAFLFPFFNSRLWALIVKEVRQIFRNKQLIFLLIFPPTVQLLIFGLALSPDVDRLALGVVDYSQSDRSRELVSGLSQNNLFIPQFFSSSQAELGQKVRTGEITIGLVIPPDFAEELSEGKPADLQIIIDGVDANTAGIAAGYAKQIINNYARELQENSLDLPVRSQVRFLYNPGLISSWFFVPGVIGVVLTLTGSLLSSLTVIREKDVGTLEQLLMTPAAGWEILLAKILPLFILLMADLLLASSLGKFVFNLPFRGNFLLFLGLSAIYLWVCIGLGILLATIARNQQQVILTSFFFNVPLIQLSGAIAPIESMPPFFRTLSAFDPLRHYVAIARGLILKGVGFEVLWPRAIALLVFAVVLLAVSISRFRRQLE
ncbi:ABC transporter permease [Oxynema aestuarii]|jgi:ABC-2 type transport system permease protein|uniref:Transport permease protein n=1 Tax=Oxynema aestuarii AP17 TaxID=2064643 RepID=A0A6H1TY17_9CYAN|nr:ABC transporter permease [Oxynema aestuarii]QIZ71295.1 ABC transporter permease [Oxynema aestuarii AP17]